MNRDAFTIQALRRPEGDPAGSAPRVGFTVTKKIGNAVVRNRIKRRLRALSAAHEDAFAVSTDYVIVARRAALGAPFDGLGAELTEALVAASAKLNRPAVRKRA